MNERFIHPASGTRGVLMSPEQQALYAAVVANPDDDLPRLVYADWLEEHGEADRAELIRVQCTRRNSTPYLAEYFDLRERERELELILARQRADERPALPDGFAWEGDERGFPYRVSYFGDLESLEAFEQDLDRIATLAPLRGLCPEDDLLDRLAELVRRPAFERFEHLYVEDGDADATALIRALASSPYVHRLTDLELPYVDLGHAAFAALAGAKTLARLDRLDAGWGGLTQRSNAALRRATWRTSLTNLILFAEDRFPVVARGVAFPRLHTLVLLDSDPTPALVDCLNDVSNFPQLAELTLSSGLSGERFQVTPIDRPLLALSLEYTALGRGGLGRLLGSQAAAHLRALQLNRIDAGRDWVRQLTRTPLPHLRALALTSRRWVGTQLTDLARAPFWATLSEVELGAGESDVTPAEWQAFFAAVTGPSLRRLSVRSARLQARGVSGLLGNTSLPSLRTLELQHCGFGETAARAVMTAPQFQRLVILDLSGNRLGAAPEVLTDPGVLPQAKLINLGSVNLPPAVVKQIRRRPEVRFELK